MNINAFLAGDSDKPEVKYHSLNEHEVSGYYNENKYIGFTDCDVSCYDFTSAQCCSILKICGVLLLSVAGVLLYFSVWLFATCKYDVQPLNKTIYFNPKSIAFGSCQDNWIDHKIINQIDTDVFIYLGDNIYGDDWIEVVSWFPKHWLWYRKILYNKLSCRRSFQRLVRRTPYILSTWDDHDYGANDDAYSNPVKVESREMFLDFWKIHETSERRRGDGIHGSHWFISDRQSILIILLDMRWFNGVSENTVLGEKQLDWIGTELNSNPAPDLIVVASSLPYASNCSDNFKGDRQRLTDLLSPFRTIFLSGDVHMAGIYMSPDGVLDVTSSPLAMTYPWSNPQAPADDRSCGATGDKLFVDNYGYLNLKTKTAYIHGVDGSVLSQAWK